MHQNAFCIIYFCYSLFPRFGSKIEERNFAAMRGVLYLRPQRASFLHHHHQPIVASMNPSTTAIQIVAKRSSSRFWPSRSPAAALVSQSHRILPYGGPTCHCRLPNTPWWEAMERFLMVTALPPGPWEKTEVKCKTFFFTAACAPRHILMMQVQQLLADSTSLAWLPPQLLLSVTIIKVTIIIIILEQPLLLFLMKIIPTAKLVASGIWVEQHLNFIAEYNKA